MGNTIQISKKSAKIEEESMDSNFDNSVELIEIGDTSFGLIDLNENNDGSVEVLIQIPAVESTTADIIFRPVLA